MIEITKTIKDGIVNGVCLSDANGSLFVPFSLCIVIADLITFSDRDVVGSTEFAGYIEVYYDYEDNVQLSDDMETVTIMKKDLREFTKILWDLV